MATPSTPVPVAGAGSVAQTLPVVLKVSFTLITPDGLRKIGFTLEKDSDGVNTTWTITFALYQKKNSTDTDFGDPVISLNVVVSPTLYPAAQNVSQNGLSEKQVGHATGPAADAAQALANGTGKHVVASTSIQNTLK